MTFLFSSYSTIHSSMHWVLEQQLIYNFHTQDFYNYYANYKSLQNHRPNFLQDTLNLELHTAVFEDHMGVGKFGNL